MIRQRCSPGADAEIRQLYEHVLDVLKKSRYGSSFEEFEFVLSPDGIGKVIKA
jgi:thymidylate synthase ThyX